MPCNFLVRRSRTEVSWRITYLATPSKAPGGRYSGPSRCDSLGYEADFHREPIFENILRGIFEDRRDEGGGVIFETPPIGQATDVFIRFEA